VVFATAHLAAHAPLEGDPLPGFVLVFLDLCGRLSDRMRLVQSVWRALSGGSPSAYELHTG